MTGVTFSSSLTKRDYATAMDRAIDTALTKAGGIFEGTAVTLAPVDTGRLRGSITWQTRDDGDRVRGDARADDKVSKPSQKWTLHVGTNVDYAPYIEYGTFKMSAQPFLRPALVQDSHRVMREFDSWVIKELKRG